MDDHRTAELVGAHLALSSPVALAWRRAVLGEIPAEEAAALMDDDAERERALQVFAPPTPERREALLAALQQRLAAEEPRHAPPVTRREPEPPPRTWRRGWGTALLALAAAVVLVVLLEPPLRNGGMVSPAGYGLDPLPGSAGYRGARSTAEPIPTYELDGKLVMVLRPERANSGAVGVVMFARDSRDRVARLAVEPVVDPSSGVVTLSSTVREAGLDVGSWELVLVVGRPEALPSSWQDLAGAIEAGDRVGYEVVRQRLIVVSTLMGP